MEALIQLSIVSIIIFAPVFHFIGFGSEIFGLPKYSVIVYIAAMVLGFMLWKPLVLITSTIAWGIIVINWGMLIWGMVRQE